MKIFNSILLKWLRSLAMELDILTFERYRRINPFYENIIPWSQKSKFFSPDEAGITIYNSTTIVGDVSIGANSWIGPFVTLDGTGGLSIGRHVSVASGAQLLSHDTARFAVSGGMDPYSYSKTKVGDYCFVGTNAIILPGRNVGNYCLIAAGAIVSKDLPDFSIAAGNPAKVIGKVIIDESGTANLIYH